MSMPMPRFAKTELLCRRLPAPVPSATEMARAGVAGDDAALHCVVAAAAVHNNSVRGSASDVDAVVPVAPEGEVSLAPSST